MAAAAGLGDAQIAVGSESIFVAIDLGTTMSGYAFSVGRTSECYVQPGTDRKEPTVLLLDARTNELIKFGKSAWEFFLVLEESVKKNYLLFDRFKMALYDDEVSNVAMWLLSEIL